MGVDIDSKLIVGLYYEDFPDTVKEIIADLYDGEIVEWIEDNELDYASPWYDAPTDKYFIGYEVQSSAIDEVIDDMVRLKTKFRVNYGIVPVVYGGKHVW